MSEKMSYGLLGEDKRTDAEKLAKYSGVVDWSYLKPHFESGALYFLDGEIELELAGVAITNDDKEAVEGWLKAGDLVKIEALHAQQWESEIKQSEEDKSMRPSRFKALVVSPFVLCQLI